MAAVAPPLQALKHQSYSTVICCTSKPGHYLFIVTLFCSASRGRADFDLAPTRSPKCFLLHPFVLHPKNALQTVIDDDFTFIRRKTILKRPEQPSTDLQDDADTSKPSCRKSVTFDESTMIGNVTMSDEIEEIQRQAMEEVAAGRAGGRQLRSRR